jgi:T5SS/PEP-CTERM-associated repeat protein
VQVSSTDGFIGYQPGSAGEAVIDGVGSIWEVEGYGGLYVGLHGNGRLEITNGGQINALVGYISRQDGSTGVVTVDGAGSMLTCSRTFHIAFGDYGKIGTNGTLNVTNGGVVNCNSHSYIAYDLQSLGLVTVDGAGSIWNNIGDLYIAHGGAGTLNILNGGAVNSTGPGYIAFESDSTGIITVDGSGSVWNNTDGLYVGKDGGGTLHIANGGKVISNKSYLGYGLGSTGKVTVDGAGSTWIGDLSIGYEGSGSLNITNGGKVSSGSCHIGYTSTATGVVTVDGTGSTWTNMHDLSVGDYESSGTLNITNGGVVSNRDGYLGYFDDSTGVVTVEGAGSTWMNSGSLHLGGKGSAMLTIARGGLVSSSRIFLNAYGNNSFVNMASGGMLALMGDAGYSLSSFLGLIEGTDSIRFWDESISDWRPLRDATYGKEYSLVYQTEGTFAGYTVLTVGVIPGDYNGDRAVGLADYTVWADFFGQTGDDLPADGNEDGLVDMADYAIWADHYGNKVDVDSDTTPPSVVDSLVPHESVYNTGDFLVFHVAWNEPLMVTGTPQLNLLIGEEERKASYYYWDNGNAFQWVTFVYRIQPGDGGVLSVSHEIDLNGGSIADAAGNPAELFVNFASTEGVVIDTTVYPISGDYNGDWKVDLADYSLWADSFGQTGDDLPADGNDDGVVDIADYTIWANHFGQTAN